MSSDGRPAAWPWTPVGPDGFPWTHSHLPCWGQHLLLWKLLHLLLYCPCSQASSSWALGRPSFKIVPCSAGLSAASAAWWFAGAPVGGMRAWEGTEVARSSHVGSWSPAAPGRSCPEPSCLASPHTTAAPRLHTQ